MRDYESSIPVLYYHSVADHQLNNNWSFLSVSIKLFRAQMRLLKSLGYSTCHWNELDDHIQGKVRLPRKTVHIHFDDGFLDNWTVVYPIMEQLQLKFTVLLTPEFVEKSKQVRDFVEKTNLDNRESWWGYLSEAEVMHMSKSGLVDFQCHGYTHTWYECSDDILEFYQGSSFLPHLVWNLNPTNKPFWLSDNSLKNIPYGYPVFEFKKSLELSRRFIPNQDFIEKCVSNSERGNEYLNDIYSDYKEKNMLGRYETEEESINRLKAELESTRDYIFSLTGKNADYVVFPGGGSSRFLIELCREMKFKMVSKGNELNRFNSGNYQLARYAGFHDFKIPMLNLILNLGFLYFQLLRGSGNKVAAQIIKIFK